MPNVAIAGGNGAQRNCRPSGLHCYTIPSKTMTNASADGRNVVASGNALDVVMKIETVGIRVLNGVN